LGINNVISLLGGVALFLFGMTLMGDGLKKVAGNKLEIILYRLTSTPLKGVLLGTSVTAVIQSSSATSVMVVGFVNSGMMQVRQAIGIVLGSILGTSITGWILCLSDISGSGWVSLLSTATLTGIVAVIGIVLRMFCKDQVKRHIGDILLGFAVLMYGMSAMSGAVAPLKDSAAFINLLTDSLPAIAIGMEPARKGLLDQKPRDPREPILNRPLLARIGGQGLLIAIVTMIAFYLGYQGGDAVMASTMAFATLTLARLFHGFNCRGSESIFRLKLSTNKYSVLAFLAGVVLLLLVLFTPGLKSLFMVAPAFGFANLGEIVLLAFLPTLVIQLVKLVCDARRGK